MTDTIDKRTNEFVSLIYDFMIDDNKSKGHIATFLLDLEKKILCLSLHAVILKKLQV